MSHALRGLKSLPQRASAWYWRGACNPANNPDVDPAWQWEHTKRGRMLLLCETCPVTYDCLQEQKLLQVDGVWGGRVFVKTGDGVREVA